MKTENLMPLALCLRTILRWSGHSIYLLALTLLFTCGTSQSSSEQSSSERYGDKVTGYDLSPTEHDSGEFQPPTQEGGGEVFIGKDYYDTKIGHKDSKAKKQFLCGEQGNECIVEVSVGSGNINGKPDHRRFEDGELVQIDFAWNNQTRTETFGTDEDPLQKIRLSGCGQVTVTISMTEGNTPGIQSRSRTLLTSWCE